MRNAITITGLFIALTSGDLTLQAVGVMIVLLTNLGEYKHGPSS